MPRINGDRFRSRIVCVRSSTPGIHTRTRAYTHTHTHTLTSSSAIPALKIEFTRNLFSTSQRFLCFFEEGRGGGAFESCFFLSPLSSDFSVPRSFPIGNSITPWTVFRLWTIMWNWGRGGEWEPLWFRLLGFAAFCWINFDERKSNDCCCFFFSILLLRDKWRKKYCKY